MAPDEKLIDKIKKLLRLAKNNPSRGESEAAVAKAMAMLEEHNLSLATIERLQESEEVHEWESKETKTVDKRESLILELLGEFFYVRVIVAVRHDPIAEFYSKPQKLRWVTHFMFGEKHNLEIAIYVLEHLKRVYMSLWRAERERLLPELGKGGKASGQGYGVKLDKTAFFEGLTVGLGTKLAAQRAATQAKHPATANSLLLTRNKLQKAAERKFSGKPVQLEPEKPKDRDVSLYLSGIREGRKIEIQKGLGAGSQKITKDRQLGSGD